MRVLKFLAVLFAVICMTAGGKALAAEDGMQVFRDAYFPGMKSAKPFHLEMMLTGPIFQGVSTMDGQIWQNGSYAMKGNLSWSYTDMATQQTTQNDIPVYAERAGDLVALYGNRNGAWQRDHFFGGVVWFMDVVSTENQNIKEQYAGAVKSVKASDAGNNRQKMDIVLDGKKLAAMQVSSDRIAALPQAEQADAQAFVNYINAALMQNDLEVIWTIDKTTGETVTVAANLTEIMRSYAKAVLEDSFQSKITLTPEESEFLTSIGYYYNLQFYLSITKDSKGFSSIPGDVKNGAVDHEFLKDVEQEMVSVIKK